MRRVLAFIVALAVSAMAHPHVFADVSVVAEFDQGLKLCVRSRGLISRRSADRAAGMPRQYLIALPSALFREDVMHGTDVIIVRGRVHI